MPVADTIPPVTKFPPRTLPVAVINPPVPKLPTLALPEIFAVPVILAPVPVTTIVVLPADTRLTLPSTVGTVTVEVPLAMPELAATAANTPLPYNTLLVLPVKLIEAMLPAPDTFASATANAVLATLALATNPDTLEPVMLDNLLPLPDKKGDVKIPDNLLNVNPVFPPNKPASLN